MQTMQAAGEGMVPAGHDDSHAGLGCSQLPCWGGGDLVRHFVQCWGQVTSNPRAVSAIPPLNILYGSKTLAAGLGSLLTAWYGVTEDQFGNMFKLVLTCNLLMLLPLPLLLFIPKGVPHTMPPSPQASTGPSTLATAPDGESGGIAQEHNPQSQFCGLLRSGPGVEPGGCSQPTQLEETKLPPAATLECQVSQLAMWHSQTYTAILAELPGTC
ncbi:BT1 family [Haematococcus lacustris]|uniref:BT1 family n=1 Tax=Haematococcus lacustris TaxID=44745 RepID=A0A699YKW2_HAELA|nr:BT1 family [Haematococcus lacustris]